MIRKLFLVLAVLALVVLTTPGPAHGRDGGPDGHGHHGHHRRHHIHHFIGVIYTPFPYGPPCWEEGHWIGQRYMDRYGHSIYAPVWVPPHWGWHTLGLADAVTLVLLFLLGVFLLGLLVGLTHMWWRARQDRLEQESEEGVSATNARSADPRAGHGSR
jgi:hypothetical protein